MTPNEGIVSSKTPYSGSAQVEVGNGQLLPIANIGKISIQTHDRPLTRNSVLYVPQLKHNLLSVHRFCHENNCHVQFSYSSFYVKDNTTNDVLLLWPGHPTDTDYPINLRRLPEHVPALAVLYNSGDVWQQRRGHYGTRVLDSLRNNKQFILLFSRTIV